MTVINNAYGGRRQVWSSIAVGAWKLQMEIGIIDQASVFNLL